jgi:hypothetical protein
VKVNVVQVTIEPPDDGPTFLTRPPVDRPVAQTLYLGSSGWINILAKFVDPGPLTPGHPSDEDYTIEWNAKVTLNGPDGDRGVKFMRVGFVQDAHVSEWNAEYGGGAFTITSSLEGQSFCDSEANDTSYYSRDDAAVFFDPDPNRPNGKVKVITDWDYPTPFVPVQWGQGLVYDVSYIHLKWDFDLYVTVSTEDPARYANEVYTSRAKAHWGFWGCGWIGPGSIPPPPGLPSGFAWTGDENARTWDPQVWSPVTDGSEPAELLPKPNDPNAKRFLDALYVQTFS